MKVREKQAGLNGYYLMIGSLLLVLALYFISTHSASLILTDQKLQLFKMVFISIILEAMPFILIGVFISALLEVFVSAQTIQKMIPKNPVLGIVTASLLGIIFPICECGMVPTIRKLIDKGMPLYVATTFILVGPILNPIVFLSTLTAFRNQPEITYTRMGLAFLIALVVGLVIYRFIKTNQLRATAHHQHEEHHHEVPDSKLVQVMGHTVSEFFEMGKYLVFGALLVGLLQTFISQESLVSIGQGQASANLLMMGLAFILSLCSTSDAFVAQSFVTTFSKGSLVAFMVFGPMLNLKVILMMLAVFKKRFIALLSLLIIVFVFTGTVLLEWLLFN